MNRIETKAALPQLPGIVDKLSNAGIVALSLFYFASFAVIGVTSMFYPFDCEWLEGNMLVPVERLLHGQPIFTPPSLTYIPFMYPAFYYHIAALVAKLVGPNYLALRSISVVSALGTGAVLLAFSRKYESPWWLKVAMLGFFFGLNGQMANWFVIGRADMLFTLLSVVSIWLLIDGEASLYRPVIAGFLAALCVLTKQQGLLMVVVAGAYYLVAGPRRTGLSYLGVASATVILLLGITGDLTNPWFYHYVFTVPASHPIRWNVLFAGVPVYLLTTVPSVLFLAVAKPWLLDLKRPRCKSYLADPALIITLAAIASGLPGKIKMGGRYNNLIAGLAIALLFVMPLLSGLHRSRFRWVKLGALVQLAVLFYPAWKWVPTSVDSREGERFIERIRQIPGEVYLPAAPNYAQRAGKNPYAHFCAFCDELFVLPALKEALIQKVANREFGAILPDLQIAPEAAGLCDIPNLTAQYQKVDDYVIDPQARVFRNVHEQKIGSIYRLK